MKPNSYIWALICLAALAWSCNNEGPNSEEAKKVSPASVASIKIGETNISVTYSSPRVKERKIWGGLVPYGQVWRTGADEASVFATDKDIMIEGNPLPAGKYAIFTIPDESEWTVILNKEYDQWGAFNYDEAKDALRFKAKPIATDNHTEALTFTLLDVAANEGELRLAWEKLQISVGFAVQEVAVK